jgi:phosphatidylglycerophosphate synthase
MKNLPNMLSVSRIMVSCVLFFLGAYPVLFTVFESIFDKAPVQGMEYYTYNWEQGIGIAHLSYATCISAVSINLAHNRTHNSLFCFTSYL